MSKSTTNSSPAASVPPTFYPVLDRAIDRILESWHLVPAPGQGEAWLRTVMRTAFCSLEEMRAGLSRSPMSQHQAENHVLRWMLCLQEVQS